MLNKRGYSFGEKHPYHFEWRGTSSMDDDWAVFDARTDEDAATGLKKWEASDLAMKLNGITGPSQETLDEIDGTP